MSSYFTLGLAVRALIMLACFVVAFSNRRLASQIMAVLWGVSLLVLLPLTTAKLAQTFGSGAVTGAMIGGVLLLLSAGFVEGLWRARKWVMVLLRLIASVAAAVVLLQMTGEATVARFLILLSWLFTLGFSVVQLRDAADAADLESEETTAAEMVGAEGAV